MLETYPNNNDFQRGPFSLFTMYKIGSCNAHRPNNSVFYAHIYSCCISYFPTEFLEAFNSLFFILNIIWKLLVKEDESKLSGQCIFLSKNVSWMIAFNIIGSIVICPWLTLANEKHVLYVVLWNCIFTAQNSFIHLDL